MRFLNMALGLALPVCAIIYGASWPSLASSVVCAAALVGLSVPRGAVRNSYGGWDRAIV